MTVVYPEEFKGNQKFPDGVDVIYWDHKGNAYPHIKHDGMTDIIVLAVDHEEDEDQENYEIRYWGQSVHRFYTNVDCRYHSKNLDHLIKKLTQIEEIL